MKKMTLFAIVFILILSVLVFVGCKRMSPGGEDSTDEPIEVTDEPVGGTTVPATPVPTTVPTEPTAPGETVSGETVSALPTNDETVSGETATGPTAEPTSESGVPVNPAEPTTSAGVPTPPAPPVPAGKTEYDIMRSGTFFLRGSMNDGREVTPLALAVKADDGTMYMESTMDNATMGFLITSKKILLLNTQSKTYCEVGGVLQSILKEAGMPTQEEMQAKIKEMGFTEMPPLAEASSVEDGAVNGTPCKVYTFNKEDGGATKVYLNGAKLLCFERTLKSGKLDSATYVTEISGTVPELPPKDFEKQNVLSFMTSMESLIG